MSNAISEPTVAKPATMPNLRWAIRRAVLGLTIMLLGVASKEHDNNKGSPPAPEAISDEQVVRLQTLIANVGADKDKFLAHMKVPTLEVMPASRFDYAVAALKQKEASQ